MISSKERDGCRRNRARQRERAEAEIGWVMVRVGSRCYLTAARPQAKIETIWFTGRLPTGRGSARMQWPLSCLASRFGREALAEAPCRLSHNPAAGSGREPIQMIEMASLGALERLLAIADIHWRSILKLARPTAETNLGHHLRLQC